MVFPGRRMIRSTSPVVDGTSRVQSDSTSLGAYAAAKGPYRSVEGIRQALEAETIAAPHAAVVASAGIDGKLASLLSNEEMRELLPDASLSERLTVLSVLHEKSREPRPQLPQEQAALGERSVVLFASGRVRENVVLVQDAVILLNGLLATISAAALLSPQCTRDTKDSLTGYACTALQASDAILWTLCLMFQLLSVGLGLSIIMTVAILDDEEEYRTWLLNNWMKHQSSMTFGVNSYVFLMPAAFAARIWLLTSWPVAIVIMVILVVSCCVVYNLLHNITVNSALKSGLGLQTLRMKDMATMGPKFWGEVGKPLEFAKVLRGTRLHATAKVGSVSEAAPSRFSP